MKKSTLIWLITAFCLTVTGIIIMVVMMSYHKWDFSKFSTVKHKTVIYDVSGEITDISVSSNTDDLIFVPCDKEDARIECVETEKVGHLVSLTDGKLSIDIKDSRKWFDFIGISFVKTKITVYIPKGEYGDLHIKSSNGNMTVPDDYSFKNIDIKGYTGDLDCSASVDEDVKIELSTGDIKLKKISAKKIDLSTSTGNIALSDINCEGEISVEVSTGNAVLNRMTCKTLSSTGSTGNINLNNVVGTGKYYIKRSTGDITLKKCDAKELYLKTSTGDITGSLLSKKVFLTDTSTGTVSVPKTTEGGKCEAETSTGDIIFR